MSSTQKTEYLSSFVEFLQQGDFKVCKGCRDIILDRIICKINNQTWHSRCLKCEKCDVQLNNYYLSNRGKIFCSKSCARTRILCGGCEAEIFQTQGIRIINGHPYHLKCFSCVKCCQQLQTGDVFYFIKGNKIICKNDYESKEDKNGNIVEQLCRKKKSRTRLDKSQRQLMETHYKINSYPARTTLQSLSNILGFSFWAIKVWFQNRRARDRREKKILASNTDHEVN